MKKTYAKHIHACPFHHRVYEMHGSLIHVHKYCLEKNQVTSLNINTQGNLLPKYSKTTSIHSSINFHREYT